VASVRQADDVRLANCLFCRIRLTARSGEFGFSEKYVKAPCEDIVRTAQKQTYSDPIAKYSGRQTGASVRQADGLSGIQAAASPLCFPFNHWKSAVRCSTPSHECD
jgi:hypothetical protein